MRGSDIHIVLRETDRKGGEAAAKLSRVQFLDATPLNSPGVWKFKVRSRTALQSLPRHGERSGTDVGPLAGSRSAPQSLTRYAYVLNDPVNFVDPLGLFVFVDPEDGCKYWLDDVTEEVLGVFCPRSGRGVGGGGLSCSPNPTLVDNGLPPCASDGEGSGQGPSQQRETGFDVDKTWGGAFRCNLTAEELAQWLIKNFTTVAATAISAGFFHFRAPEGIREGAQVFPWVTTVIPVPAFGGTMPVVPQSVTIETQVTVRNVNSTGFGFVTNPVKHFFEGTVEFRATSAGKPGWVNFTVTAQANFSNSLWEILGALIRRNEDAAWSHLVQRVAEKCAEPR